MNDLIKIFYATEDDKEYIVLNDKMDPVARFTSAWAYSTFLAGMAFHSKHKLYDLKNKKWIVGEV